MSTNMVQKEYIRIVAQIAVLKDIVEDGYGGKTIDNVIQQLESRKKDIDKKYGGLSKT